jgi:hypothetical protein
MSRANILSSLFHLPVAGGSSSVKRNTPMVHAEMLISGEDAHVFYLSTFK